MQQDNQESYPYQTNEIDLRVILISLVERKLFILGLTIFITLLSVIYSLNIPPTYKATTSFTSPSDSSMLSINKMSIMGFESKNSVFAKYLTSLSSREFQQKVFNDGDYFTELNPKNNSIDDIDSYASGFINSINLSPPDVTAQDRDLGVLTELPYSLSIEGGNAEVISSYLNDLVESANTNTINELTNLLEQKINNRLDAISLERNLLLVEAKLKRLNEIEVLTYASKIAGTLGIQENNFKLISEDVIDSNFTIALGINHELPQWYLYGDRALNERIKLLQSRTNDEPFTDGLVRLNMEKLKLESIIIDSSDINAMVISQIAATPKGPIRPNKRAIVLITFIGSFMMSIFLALIMNAFKPDKLTTPE